ncbi:MAG: thymidylate synthase (FAD) [Candidatus Aminicenantes bacterium]|nr:thymidylate synthase (FAD) [Candidatus Aminicenantes bacterium]
MRVILAGYNVDSTVIDELKKNSPGRGDVTPETLSASYARISRDPRSVDQLRSAARAEVKKARRSNQTIIFKMGHHSVAEHAVFNFDVIGMSRLAIEKIEKFRLCSYTEKSQRYIKLKDDFVVPQEIKKSGKTQDFIKVIREQNRQYQKLYEKLRPYFYQKYPDMALDKKKQSVLDGWAKEDARYIVSLATEGQLGMTINARNLELMIRRFSSKKLEELKEFNQKIYTLAKEVAPSIILFTEPNDFDGKTYQELRDLKEASDLTKPGKSNPVCLVDSTPDADIKVVAAFLHTVSGGSFQHCLQRARGLSDEKRKKVIKTALYYMEFFDAVPREFEYVDLTFDLIVSATCFAQLKRHRMATLTSQKYNPEVGVTIPPSVKEVGCEHGFMDVIQKTDQVYMELKDCMETGAEYVLTNAHQRRVLLKMNAREFYHFSRLREDATAQWEIRRLAQQMSEQAKKVMPLTMMLIGGKDQYPEIYKSVFGRSPKLKPP